MPIELPIEADLSKAMPLEDRVKAFLPFLPDDNDMAMELFKLFAVSVPDDMTRVDNDWVMSPVDKEKVEVKAIHTEIDKEGIRTVAENFLGGLQENEELLGDVQAMANEFTAFFGLDDVDLGDEIAGIDLSEIENADFSEIEWTVYEYEGEYIGISFGVDADEVDMQIIYMSEFRDDEINYSTQILIDGEETQTTTGSVRGDGERMLFDMESSMTQQISMDGDETTTEMEVSGEIMAKQTGKDNYDLTMDYDLIMEMDMGDMGLGMVEMPDEMEIGLSIEADCALGSELESMRDSRDWNDIYDMDWGDIDGLMQGLFGITGMMM